jgi:hypothetical protein
MQVGVRLSTAQSLLLCSIVMVFAKSDCVAFIYIALISYLYSTYITLITLIRISLASLDPKQQPRLVMISSILLLPAAG